MLECWNVGRLKRLLVFPIIPPFPYSIIPVKVIAKEENDETMDD
jgi:hypothetical protein